MKILICGDSFCVTDPRFPGLHWSEKLLNRSAEFEVMNMAYGGCSNAMIVMQIMQGLQFNPDFVIISFTSAARYEIDKDVKAIPLSLSFDDITDWAKSRYTSNLTMSTDITPAVKKRMSDCSDVFEIIKNYFFVVLALQLISKHNIPFCYSIGGLEFCEDYTALVRENFLPNFLDEYKICHLDTNLWYHNEGNSPDLPYFHIKDDRVQELFYNECIMKLQDSIYHSKH